MAIINNNVGNVKFLRNGNLFSTHEAALTGIQTEFAGITSTDADGTAILARYGSGTEVKTLVGWVYYSDSSNKSLTIFDIEGASGDVETLRQEINAKLGNGVSSGAGETVTDQLAALSGGTFTPGTSSSADTSVEGAKAYAKDYTDEQIGELEYTGVTTGDGKVIVNVTETDGKVSGVTAEVGGLKLTDYSKGSDSGAVAATDSINDAFSKVEKQIDAVNDTIDALDYTDTASAKTFVTKVDEVNGVIETTKGTITSSAGTIVLSDNTDGGVNFDVHIDGVTILKNSETGELSVANSALIQYVGDDDTVQVSEAVAGVKTISSPLTIQKVTTGLSEEVKEEYHLVGASGTTIGDPVKIYKDSHIVSITYITDTGDTHYQNLEYVYLDASGATKTEYVDISMLVLEAEFASGLTIENHVARGVVDPTSELDSNNDAFLTVGADGFKIDGIKDEIDKKLGDIVSNLDATVTGSTSGSHITISIEELDGKLVQSGLTIQEDNIADADDLAELSGKAVTEIASSNASISANSAATADGTVGYDLVTDASKIKMSGFTSTDVLSGITSSSSITEAFKEVESVISDNERVTAEALNDLNTRVETVSGDVQTISGKVNTIESGYVSGVTVNGTSVVTDKVGAISIESATSAMTATSTEAIVVDTDANGNITLGLAIIDCGTYD